jgi:NADH-ubiquinone oxidoreductase chain 5
VSALVHSSTLVTAGVYLIIRYGILIRRRFLKNYLIFVSLLTLIMAGLCANFEFDLKKIIALSTLSQLGVMLFIVGLGNFLVGYYHILIHAMFKALLFLCAGGFIHSLNNYQDIRYLRGIGKFTAYLGIGFNGCSLALMGFPFLAGFYSKDLICEYILISKLNLIIVFLFLVRIGLTSIYSLKAIIVVYGEYKGLSYG